MEDFPNRCKWNPSNLMDHACILIANTIHLFISVFESLDNIRVVNPSISESCANGKYLDPATGCEECPSNHWSSGGTVSACTPCPAGEEVLAGMGTKEDDCKCTNFVLQHS